MNEGDLYQCQVWTELVFRSSQNTIPGFPRRKGESIGSEALKCFLQHYTSSKQEDSESHNVD